MFRTFVLRCDWSILRILKSTKKHERQSERVTLVSIYNNIFRLCHNEVVYYTTFFILDVVFMSEFLSYSVDTFLKTIDC